MTRRIRQLVLAAVILGTVWNLWRLSGVLGQPTNPLIMTAPDLERDAARSEIVLLAGLSIAWVLAGYKKGRK
jgi:hypothetical protein